MNDADKEQCINEFKAVTGSEAQDDATFYLESADWNLQMAVDTFFGARAADEGEAAESSPQEAQPESSAQKPNLTFQNDAETSEKEERWYTGGGVGSGQEVIAPSSGRKPVDDVFNAARELGARSVTAADLEPAPSAFTGGARTLNGGVVKAKEAPKRHVIKFYANEIFTVDEGPPRNIHDKVNQAFMQSIMKGECPPELETTATTEVSLIQVEEDYVEAQKPRAVFQGSGQRLGASSSASPVPAPAPAAGTSGPWDGPNADLPMTSIQLRLPDGSRLVAKFNHTQPLSDIRKFVAAARPDISPSYSLLTGFPAKPVSDESVSLEDAGLLNALITLR